MKCLGNRYIIKELQSLTNYLESYDKNPLLSVLKINLETSNGKHS